MLLASFSIIVDEFLILGVSIFQNACPNGQERGKRKEKEKKLQFLAQIFYMKRKRKLRHKMKNFTNSAYDFGKSLLRVGKVSKFRRNIYPLESELKYSICTIL